MPLPAALPEPLCDGLLVSVAQPDRKLCIKPGSGETFKDCPRCPEMVIVPSGSFMMGSPENETGRLSNEDPQHLVTFGKPFAAGRFAVTFAEWDACRADGGCAGYIPGDQGWGQGGRPVGNVTWNNAKSYAGWLSKRTGRSYRLLSEAEREYVARAGTATPFWCGSSISTDQANYDGNHAYGDDVKGEQRKETLPVDSFKPNPWGLYQVHGNVYDWVEDCFHNSYQGAPSDGTAWTTGDCTYRVLRGGSRGSEPQYLRAAFRNSAYPDSRDYEIGFRVGRTLD
jgi:formylglycine-generating enzyme required for sulfatase activity